MMSRQQAERISAAHWSSERPTGEISYILFSLESSVKKTSYFLNKTDFFVMDYEKLILTVVNEHYFVAILSFIPATLRTFFVEIYSSFFKCI